MSGQLYMNPPPIRIWAGEKHTLRAMIVREGSWTTLAPDLRHDPVKELGQPRTPLVYIKYLRRVLPRALLLFPLFTPVKASLSLPVVPFVCFPKQYSHSLEHPHFNPNYQQSFFLF